MADHKDQKAPGIPFIYTGQGRLYIPNDVEHVVVASTVTRIGCDTFHSCTALTSIDFPDGLQLIDKRAFENCPSLNSVVIPSTVEKIGHSAFDECFSLKMVELREGNKEIGPRAFLHCRCMMNIKIPSSINRIGFSAFEHCRSLVDVTLPEGLLRIQYNSFKDCGSLTKITVPSTVEVIADGVFMNCVRLAFIDLPERLEQIGSYSFANCRALTNVLIPSSVESIGNDAFLECLNLISVELPEGLLEIGDMVFRWCSSLSNVAIPISVVECGELVLSECEKLQGKFPSPGALYDFTFNRFDALPLHKLCYNQGHYPTATCMERLTQVIESDPTNGKVVDAVGMTPFHILALSAKPNCFLFQELMTLYPIELLSQRDAYGCSPMFYLSLNPSPNATTLMRIVLQATVVKRLKRLGLQRWRLDVSYDLDYIDLADVPLRTEQIGKIHFKLAKYERMEAISLLEQALWKVKLNKSAPKVDIDHIDRHSCRINCGSDAVISNAMPFLDKVDPEDYSWSSR